MLLFTSRICLYLRCIALLGLASRIHAFVPNNGGLLRMTADHEHTRRSLIRSVADSVKVTATAAALGSLTTSFPGAAQAGMFDNRVEELQGLPRELQSVPGWVRTTSDTS